MSTLKQRLHDDLTSAMRSGDTLRRDTLRMALAAVTNAEVAGDTARELDDAEVETVLVREVKKRREAVTAYQQAGRDELAERERAEATVLQDYLPQALTHDEVAAIVAAAVAEAAAAGQSGPRAMGAVMKLVQPQVRGRADGSVVAAAVRNALAATD